MAVTPRLAAAVVIPILTFAIGYLLGASPTNGTGNNQEVLANQRELIRSLRELSEHGTGRRDGQRAAPHSALAKSASANDDASRDGMRLPSLDAWIARIDEAVKRLEDAAKRGSDLAPPDPTETLRRASRRDLPRNDIELKRFVREYEAAETTEYDTEEEYDRIWDALYSKYLYQSMESLLDRFGRPDDISVAAGAATWEYYYERSLPDGLTEDWGVTLEFADGVLIDFYGYWNRVD